MLEWLDALPNFGVPAARHFPASTSAALRAASCQAEAILEHRREHPEHPAEHLQPMPSLLIKHNEHKEHREHRQNDEGTQEWDLRLAALNPSRAPAGVAGEWWHVVLADARWLARQHGETAAAFGWTASDLFGVRDAPGWGGVADRLDGARDVRFDARRVRWSYGDGDWAVLIRMASNGRMALQCGAPLWDLAA